MFQRIILPPETESMETYAKETFMQVEAGGITIRFELPGPDVVLSHCLSGRMAVRDPQVVAQAVYYRVLRYDLARPRRRFYPLRKLYHGDAGFRNGFFCKTMTGLTSRIDPG